MKRRSCYERGPTPNPRAVVTLAKDPDDIETVRELFQEYAAFFYNPLPEARFFALDLESKKFKPSCPQGGEP